MVERIYWKSLYPLFKLQMTNKSIDINQRIPLDTLYAVLESYLNDSYSNEYVLEQLRLEYNGENRLKKSLRIVNKIIIKTN